MMYPFITLDDETEITHSEMLANGTVKVYIERADEQDVFHHAVCYLPDDEWTDIYGFSEVEMECYQKIIRNMANLIMEFSQKGGFRGASGLEN